MRAILDTHVFLWWNADDPHLSKEARRIIADGRNELFVSAASAWEIALKVARGRLALPEPPALYVGGRMNLHHFQPLPIQLSHALHIYNLPDIHRDPFDRLLIAQSKLEDLPIMTADPQIAQYDVRIVW